MGRKATASSAVGCLLPILGALTGILVVTGLAIRELNREVAEILAQDPDAFVCGTPFIGVVVVGVIAGGSGGLVVGSVAGLLWEHRRSKPCSAMIVELGRHSRPYG